MALEHYLCSLLYYILYSLDCRKFDKLEPKIAIIMSNIRKPNLEAFEILSDIINRSVWLKQVRKSFPFTEEDLKELEAINNRYEKLSKHFLERCEDNLK